MTGRILLRGLVYLAIVLVPLVLTLAVAGLFAMLGLVFMAYASCPLVFFFVFMVTEEWARWALDQMDGRP
jgi:hypothetical protein